MNLASIKKIAYAEFGSKRSAPYNEKGDKFTHGERVAKIAVQLRELLLPNESNLDDILTIAGWFHDIYNAGGVDRKTHCVLGAERTRELLTEHCTEDQLEQICNIIAVHDERKPNDNNYSNAVKILQDADHLDHFGAIGIWRFAAYAVGHDGTMNDAAQHIQENRTSYVEQWSTEFNFELSRQVFDDKMRFENAFFERFILECGGSFGGDNNAP